MARAFAVDMLIAAMMLAYARVDAVASRAVARRDATIYRLALLMAQRARYALLF